MSCWGFHSILTEQLSLISSKRTARGSRLRFQQERSKVDILGILKSKGWKYYNLLREVMEYFFPTVSI